MKVLLIAPPWLPVPPSGYTGTEAVLDTLARGHAGRPRRVLFTTGDSTCDLPMQWVRRHAAGIGAGNSGVEFPSAFWSQRMVEEHVHLYERVAGRLTTQVDAGGSQTLGASRSRRTSARSVPISASHVLSAALE